MSEHRNWSSISRSAVCFLAAIWLYGCASRPEAPVEAPVEPVVVAKPPDQSQKISELERQIAEKQHQCLVDKRRLENSLKELQKQNDDLRRKLDGLLDIDRDLRSRGKAR